MMNIKKIVGFSILPLVLTGLIFPQSLTEAAKKEKERRETLKGKKTVTVSNADLGKVKRGAAFVASGSGAESKAEPGILAGSKAGSETGTGAAPSPALPVGVGSQQVQSSRSAAEKMKEQTKTELEEKYNKAKEYRELLELKMNALQQQFFNMADTKSKDLIQKDIADTYAKLLGAQEAETKAREELEKFLGESLKDKLPPVWIK